MAGDVLVDVHRSQSQTRNGTSKNKLEKLHLRVCFQRAQFLWRKGFEFKELLKEVEQSKTEQNKSEQSRKAEAQKEKGTKWISERVGRDCEGEGRVAEGRGMTL